MLVQNVNVKLHYSSATTSFFVAQHSKDMVKFWQEGSSFEIRLKNIEQFEFYMEHFWPLIKNSKFKKLDHFDDLWTTTENDTIDMYGNPWWWTKTGPLPVPTLFYPTAINSDEFSRRAWHHEGSVKEYLNLHRLTVHEDREKYVYEELLAIKDGKFLEKVRSFRICLRICEAEEFRMVEKPAHRI